MSANALGREGRPVDVAEAVHWLASEAAAWVTGAVLRVDGGSTAGTTALPPHWSGDSGVQEPREETRA